MNLNLNENLAIIAIRVANDIPVQSNYVPMISVYFLLSILYTFISFAWFVIADKLKTKKINSTEINITFWNRIVFLIIFNFMLISFLVVWLIISN